jgi:hypothetical protein
MLLTFEKRDATTLPLGTFKVLRFDGGELRAPGSAVVIAKHEEQYWRLGGEDYLRLDCDGPLTVMFFDGPSDKSRPFGPYAHFSSVDGIGYADHHVFCHLDAQTARWFLRAEQSEWATLVIEDASP